jgi:hypothetical protein
MKRFWLGAAVLILFGACNGASAADVTLPVKAPPRAAVGQYGGWYVWLDGSYQDIRLPSVGLGFKVSNDGVPSFSDLGPRHQLDPEATGVGVRGAVGYVFPHGTMPAFFGSNARLEIGGSYIDADGSQTQVSNIPTGSGVQSSPIQFLNGALSLPVLCGFGTVGCSHTSTLETDYRAWRIEGKLAGDHQVGSVTLTPWLSVFGGKTRADHTLAQSFVATFVPTFIELYNASTSLRWTDVGAKLGLDAKVAVTTWLAAGLGGSIGLAGRNVSLSGADTCTDSASGDICTIFGTAGPGFSTISTGANTTPFLANAEASVMLQPLANLSARGFVGVNYDSRVPGISSPTFAGVSGFATQPVTPAGIKFERETSWYAGGGAVWKFAP